LPEGQALNANARWVSPSYFSVLAIPILEGRAFTLADREHRHVLMLSQKTARDIFPGEDPIGRTVRFEGASYTVAGVVADARINNLKTDADMVYAPYWERPPWTISFLVRGSQSSDALAPAMRRAIWKIDPQVAIPVLKSMDDQVTDSVATERFTTFLLSSFGFAALMLALLGVYGVLAYTVSLRQQEFGIRIALGSDKAALVELVLRQASRPICLGLILGLICSFAATRWVRSLLYDSRMVDPIAIAAGVVLVLGVSFLAAILPARRAAQVDPMQVLRNE
jgi:ABC-type antimicrobial peptide transport system permease subunit